MLKVCFMVCTIGLSVVAVELAALSQESATVTKHSRLRRSGPTFPARRKKSYGVPSKILRFMSINFALASSSESLPASTAAFISSINRS
jgi:hypothetical protein